MLEKKNNLFLTVEFVIETFQQLLLTEVEAIGKSELEELSILLQGKGVSGNSLNNNNDFSTSLKFSCKYNIVCWH